MNTVKVIKKDKIKLNGVSYKGYVVGDLPQSFGYIKKEMQTDEGLVSDLGHREWFNYNGLTFIKQN
jgi:hypothetical protein|tara:strand:+ start:201 stop:398 length:198 start_codon:yes stop_codon:yes gene_type:complete